jgi:hypothetical protein
MRETEAVKLEGHGFDWQRQQIRLVQTKANRPRILDWKTPGGDACSILTVFRR